MKDEPNSGLPLTLGILRAILGLWPLLGIASIPLTAQLSMGRSGFTRTPPSGKRMAVPAKPAGGSTTDADKRLVEAIQNLTPKDRKKLAKAMKRMSPEERVQVINAMKRRLAPAPHASGLKVRK